MPIIRNEDLPTFELSGLGHRMNAGHAQGVSSMEVWHQVMAPGAETPIYRDARDEVILVLTGSGRVMVEGDTSDLYPGTVGGS